MTVQQFFVRLICSVALSLPAQAQLPCNGLADDIAIAAAMAMPTDRLARFKAKHQLSNVDFCGMTEAQYYAWDFALDAAPERAVQAGYDRLGIAEQQDTFGEVDPKAVAAANLRREVGLRALKSTIEPTWLYLGPTNLPGVNGRVLTLAAKLIKQANAATAPGTLRLFAGTAHSGIFYQNKTLPDNGTSDLTSLLPSYNSDINPWIAASASGTSGDNWTMGSLPISGIASPSSNTDINVETLLASVGFASNEPSRALLSGPQIILQSKDSGISWQTMLFDPAGEPSFWTELKNGAVGIFRNSGIHSVATGNSLFNIFPSSPKSPTPFLSKISTGIAVGKACNVVGTGSVITDQSTGAFVDGCSVVHWPYSSASEDKYGISTVIQQSGGNQKIWKRAALNGSSKKIGNDWQSWIVVAARGIDNSLKVYRCQRTMSDDSPCVKRVDDVNFSWIGTEEPYWCSWTIDEGTLPDAYWDDAVAVWVNPNNPDDMVVAGRHIWRSSGTSTNCGGLSFKQIGNSDRQPAVTLSTSPTVSAVPKGVNQILGLVNSVQFVQNTTIPVDIYRCPLAATACDYTLYFAADDGVYSLNLAKLSTQPNSAWTKLIAPGAARINTVSGAIRQDGTVDLVSGVLGAGIVRNSFPTSSLTDQTTANEYARKWITVASGGGGQAWFTQPSNEALKRMPPNSQFIVGTYGYFTPFRKAFSANLPGYDFLPPDTSIRSGLTAASMSSTSGFEVATPRASVKVNGIEYSLFASATSLWVGKNLNGIFGAQNDAPSWQEYANLPFSPTALVAKALGANIYVLMAGKVGSNVRFSLSAIDTTTNSISFGVLNDYDSALVSRVNSMSLAEYTDISGNYQLKIWVATPTGMYSIRPLSPTAANQQLFPTATLDTQPRLFVASHPNYPRWAYAGTLAGMELSTNDGQTWEPVKGPGNQPLRSVGFLEDGRVVAGTDGQGIWMTATPVTPFNLILEQTPSGPQLKPRATDACTILDVSLFNPPAAKTTFQIRCADLNGVVFTCSEVDLLSKVSVNVSVNATTGTQQHPFSLAPQLEQLKSQCQK